LENAARAGNPARTPESESTRWAKSNVALEQASTSIREMTRGNSQDRVRNQGDGMRELHGQRTAAASEDREGGTDNSILPPRFRGHGGEALVAGRFNLRSSGTGCIVLAEQIAQKADTDKETSMTNKPVRRLQDRRRIWSLGRCWLLAWMTLAAGLLWAGSPVHHRRGQDLSSLTSSRSPTKAQPQHARVRPAKKIEDIQVGDRVVGVNPLREQVEKIQPETATWRKISLCMRKTNGLSLWIELLRPLEWVEETGAAPGKLIQLELAEMGAVGEAAVTKIGPCPPIKPGDGTVVTGKFVHQCDGSNVLKLRVEGQQEATCVTGNHYYWSADRGDFVEAGKLRVGESVDTVFGPSHVTSVVPYEYMGLLYNLETSEHVYRVGSWGTLVHNSCWEIVLSVGAHINEFTQTIGAGAKGTVVRWPFFPYSKATDTAMWPVIERALNATKHIYFNMKGMTKANFQEWLRKGYYKFAPNPKGGGWTNRELYEVLTHPELLKKATFYDEFGNVIDAPLEWLILP